MQPSRGACKLMRGPCGLGILLATTAVLWHGYGLAQPAVAPDQYDYADSPYANMDDINYLEINAPNSPEEDAGLPACETAAYPIFASDLINLPETDCNSGGFDVPYTRNSSFGISWMDDYPGNCSIYTVTIAIQAGLSCSGLAGGGVTMLNNYVTPALYRFPYFHEYNYQCSLDCNIPPSPIQTLNFDPGSAYNQSGYNEFLIYNSSASNGLSSFIPNASLPIFGLVITNSWVQADNMDGVRSQFAFIKAQNERILATGGVTINGLVTATADEYDPVQNDWTPTNNNLSSARQLHAIARLNDRGSPDSRGAYYVVVSGGVDNTQNVLSSADVYNTSSRSWTPAPRMRQARARHTLTSLGSGTRSAIAVGGIQDYIDQSSSALNTAEAYSWDLNTWNFTLNNMTHARYRHQALLHGSSSLLVMGGQDATGNAIASVEMLNIATGNFSSVAPMHDARYAFTATNLTNGSILVVGGAQLPNTDKSWVNSQLLTSCEIYSNGVWTYTGNLTYARAGHQAVVQADGTVMVTGGGGPSASLASEVWDSQQGDWVTVAPLPAPKINFGLVSLPGGRTFAFGGSTNTSLSETNGTSSSYLYTSPFSLSDVEPFTALVPVPAPSLANIDSLRAPPISAQPPAPPTFYSPANRYFANSPLPDNTSIQVIVEQGSSGLSGGAIGGIVGGVVGGSAILACIIAFFLWRRRKQRRARRYSPENMEKIQGKYGANGSHSGHHHYCIHYSEDGTPILVPHDSARTSSKSLGSQNGISLSGSATTVPFSNRALASPFATSGLDKTGTPNRTEIENHSNYPKSVALPKAIAPSPFSSEPTSLHSNTSGTALKSLQSIDETTATTTGGSYSAPRPLVQTEPGDNKLITDPSASKRSISSDLSRVSYQVRNELIAADWKIDRSALVLGRQLGKGGFGEVFKAHHHGSSVAVKVLEINDERMLHDACVEFGHLHNLRHSKLVISYGACIDATQMLLVMELMEEDLFHAIANDSTGSGDSVLWNFRGWQIAVDVASALVFLHSKGLIHLDVKSLNILLKGRRTEAKLGDLGLAKLVPDGHLALQNTLPGTPAYSAPEVIQAQLSWRLRTQGRRDQFRTSVGSAADIFAFGVVLFEICTGQHPARWRQDFSGELRPDQAPPEIAKLIDDCLSDEPGERPTARQLLDTLLQHRPRHVRDPCN